MKYIIRTPRGRRATSQAYQHLGVAEPEVEDEAGAPFLLPDVPRLFD